MKNTRWFRFTAALLALVMILTLSPFAVLAEGEGEENPPANPPEPAINEYMVDDPTIVKARPKEYKVDAFVSYLDESGKSIDVESMDPNLSNKVKISASGLSKLEGISKEAHILVAKPSGVELTEGALLAAGNENVSVTVETNPDDRNEYLVFTWKDELQDSIDVTIAAIPNLPADGDLSGTYVIATDEAMLGYEFYNEGGRGKLKSYPIEKSGGQIIPMTIKNSLWTLKHVSGNYYTVYSQSARQYLRIYPPKQGGFSGNGSVSLESVAEENAQKIQIVNNGDGYTFNYIWKGKTYSLNNSGENKYYGFASYEFENKPNYKFTLYSLSDVKTSATRDLSGTWALANTTRTRLLSKNSNQSGKLNAVAYNPVEDGTLIPNNNYDTWTFEHITRDWYYVSCNGNYLHISSKGVSMSGEKMPLLALSSDGFETFMLSDGIFDVKNGQYYALRSKDNDFFDAVLTGGFGDNYKIMSIKSASSIANNNVTISGSKAITTETTGMAVMAEVNGITLNSVRYMMTDDGKVYNREKTITTWNFTQINGNWYSITTEDGRYLSITPNGLSLTNTPAQVFVQEYQGKYRFTNGDANALKSVNSYTSNKGGKAVDKAEWHTLRSVFNDETQMNMLVFDPNGGTVANLPNIIMGEAGSTITLPDMEASKNGGEFIGWYTTTGFYSIAQGEKSTYHKLLKPNTSYTMPSGETTLYAVYDLPDHNVRFGIRKDGRIQDEPNVYDVSQYIGHFWMRGSVRKAATWVIDLNPQKAVNDYYLDNDVVAALNIVPSAEEIIAGLKADGNVDFDPETQYIHWYVLKYTGKEWHIDGVIRDKEKVEITYDANVEDVNEKTAVAATMPGGSQVAVGTGIMIGAKQGTNEIQTPVRAGYTFNGWNTEADGTGTAYNEKSFISLTNNLHLFAQWVSTQNGELSIAIDPDWPDGMPAYAGTKITLTAVLTGFGDKEYDLQWQYSPDQRATWLDVEGEDQITMTYILDETTATYIWRVVARNVRNKQ